MPRTPRFVVPEAAHHIVVRGNNRNRIFHSGFDKARYLKKLAALTEELGILVHAYCLMDNHLHLVLTPKDTSSLGKLMSRLQTYWAIYFNKKYDRCGHVFQSRYYSTPLAETHYWNAMRYVELNPKTAGLVDDPTAFRWSSAREHVTGKLGKLVKLVPAATLSKVQKPEWAEFLRIPARNEALELERANRGCRPWGPSEWIEKLQRLTTKKLTCRIPKSEFKNSQTTRAA